MEFKHACCILQRVLLPIILGICLLLRPVGLSYIYLLLFLFLPFIPLGKTSTFRASLTAYLIILITLSAIITACHIGLLITAKVLGPESFLENCSFEEVLIRHIGFIYVEQVSVTDTLQWIWPDVLVLICAVIVFVLMKRLSGKSLESDVNSTNGEVTRTTESSVYKILQKMGPLASLASLFLASAFRPSVPGGLYFLMFLICTTYWACKRSLARGFAMLLRFVMLIQVFHTVAIISYQTPWVQIKLSNSTLPARLMGLEPLTLPLCTSQNEGHSLIIFNPDLNSDSYLNPMMILMCYYILALTSNHLMKIKNLAKQSGGFSQFKNDVKLIRQVSLLKQPVQNIKSDIRKRSLNVSSWQNRPSEAHEKTPLMNRSTKKSSEERSMAIETDNIELENLRGSNEADVSTSFLDHIWYGVLSSCAFVYKNSYIFTNILMMVWSIVYHSWLTFVLLIWANILWMIPNQRKTMLRSSPFIVLYAELLLVAQYIYGMKLEQYELPDKVDMKGINLEQIGLVKSKEMPCVPLFVKTAFTLMFWLTLKQRCKEEEEKKKTSTIADMVAPMQLTVGTAASDITSKPMEQKTSKFFEKIGSFIKSLLIKLWIWLLLIIVFVSGITGTKMTGFRICYMALFLFFVLAFQCSWKAWIKVMYGFWLFLIFYGMSILILIYTYQFDRFDEYWNDYLNISKSLQKDIGLERYETKDLFLHLVTPTILVIMTIIHIHYFHNRFVENLKQDVSERARSISPDVDLAALNEQGPSEEVEEVEGDGSLNPQNENENEPEALKKDRLKGFRKLSKAHVKKLYGNFRNFVMGFMEFLWTLFEIHLIKVVFLTVIIFCFAKICMLHILFVFLSVAAFMTRTWVQTCISRFISVLVATLMLGNMIYQVDYLDHKKYNVNCNNETTGTTTPNNAKWFGLEKIPQSDTLLYLLRGYIVYIVITTIHAVVVFRQEQKRARQGLPLDRPAVIFTKVTNKDSEKDFLGLIKYLFNYCYFRFGFEITLVFLVSTIAYRQDLLAIIYSFWFCILICLEREKSEKIWFLFSCFVAIVIPAQYILFVGFPPGLCIVYPWEGISTEGLYGWAMLPGPALQHETGKVVFDFVLLLFISRQGRVYAIEKPFDKSNTVHPGGSNKSILLNMENSQLTPPQTAVHDFKSVVRNWLDILHVFVFSGFYWITLAVIFLAGTNVISMFSIGYLGGSFIFLWQGTDFYLRPIKKIVKRWKIFLAYNVTVITLKTCLQIGVCLFFKDLTKHACWLVHFLGVGCVGKVNPETKECPPLRENSGLVWDATCFAFLIFQLRIFSSNYFRHVINDTKASAILASRGAVLIEDLRQKQIQHRTRHEKEILRKIKAKMEKIRATQQKIIRPAEKPTHFEVIDATNERRDSSVISCSGSGYHTPKYGMNNNEKVMKTEVPSDLGELLSVTAFTGSSLQNQVSSPTSAIMTVSLDDYLDPQRMSLESRINSEAQGYRYDGTAPVFSNGSTDIKKHAIVTPHFIETSEKEETQKEIFQERQHRRQSSVNTVSWNEASQPEVWYIEKTVTAPNGTDGCSSILRKQRHTSSGSNTCFQEDINIEYRRRRSSYLSWANDESPSTKTTSARAHSWGPVANKYYAQSLSTEMSPPSSHGESMRAGDYYMFDVPDEKIELSLMDEGGDFLEDEGKISASERKISKRKGLFEVCQEIEKRKRTKSMKEADPAFMSKIGRSKEKRKEQRTTIIDSLSKSSSPKLDKEKAAELSDSPDQPTSSKDFPPEKPEDKQEKGAVARIFEGIMVSLAISLNRFSRNYRYVMKILSNEKKTLKESMKGIRPGFRETWIPCIKSSDEEDINTKSEKNIYNDTGSDQHIDTRTISDIEDDTNDHTTRASGEASIAVIGPELESNVVPEIRILAPSLERGLDASVIFNKEPCAKKLESPEEFDWDENEFTTRDHPIVVEVLISGWYAILSNTDIICYLFVFINQITSASILSIPLPIMVFMWGTLAIPRPTKSFWVTLIAYTQCVVIIKCMFQFKTFAFQNVNLPNQPLSADKIIGIEQKDNYAIYDLLLLLVLFLHRFILKSQGLWDSHDLEPIVQTGTYIVKNELPEDDDNGSVQELHQTVIVTKGRDTLFITKTQLGDSTQENEINSEVSDKIEESGNYVPEVVKITSAKYFSPVMDFFKNLLYKSRLPSDVYALMFLCDFVNFFVLLFGCPAFGTQYGDGGVHTYFTENKVPIPFLIMLLVQFILIVVDRALYLRKALIFKIVFHFLAVIGIHIWMFFVLPAITERQFNALIPPVMFYLIKCFYFLLSSYQITCGYPKRILGNFLTRGYTLINMISFKIYKLIPFLFELRTFLDWVCTDTTMTIWEWLKMENIFSEIYFIKCSRDYEKSFPIPRAQKKDMIMKIILGGSAILLWVIVIWAPLTTYAVFTAVGESNIPTEISVVMKIGPYSPIYIMQSQDAVSAFDVKAMTQLQSFYLQNKSAMTFITSYYESDIATISLPAHSQTVWGISPPEKETLLNELLQNHTLPVRFFYKITKLSSGKNDEEDILSMQTYYELQKEGRESLILMLQGKLSDGYILVPNIFPKFIEIKNTNKINIISKMMPNEQQYVSLLLRLSSKSDSGGTMWWHVTENCNDTIHRELLSELPYAECGKLMTIYTFNDKKFPRSFLGLFSASGIIGMYTGIVLVFSRIVRGVIFDSTSRIMFSDLPYVDRVLQLCLDVYLVREAKEFALEEDLFAKLLFLYRSPETMIKWTRPKEEGSDTYDDIRPMDSESSHPTVK